MAQSRVIGVEHIEAASRRGRIVFEILPNDIVTSLARETAVRVGVKLVDGPLEKINYPRTDGHTSMRRMLYRRSPKWLAPRVIHRKAQRFTKLAIIGAGGVGSTIAHLAANRDIADEVALIDTVPGLAEATALDLNHASGITGTGALVTGSTDLNQITAANVVVVTAGRARTPGMTRTDLIGVNRRVIHCCAEAIKSQAPAAIVIVVTNPLDEMTVEMLRASGFPRERVLGMAGTLDSSRFRNALAIAASVKPADVQAITLGSHGDQMTPVISLARIKGRTLSTYLSDEQIATCVNDAVTGGGQVVARKKTGSACIAPAHSTLELLDYMRGARIGSVPVSVRLDGEYGIENVVLGVPAHLGMGGLIAIEELTLALHTAADAIRSRVGL